MVRELNGLYFAPDVRFSELDLDDPEALAEACRKRINSHFLEPANSLVAADTPFAAGITCIAALDCLAGWTQDGVDDPPEWLPLYIPELSQPDPREDRDGPLAESFWNEVRHGLAHEGRLNRGAQFSTRIEEPVAVVEEVLHVNPAQLLQGVQTAYQKFFQSIEDGGNVFRRFSEELRRIHRRDLEIDRTLP